MLKQKNVTIIGFGDSITEAVIDMPDENKRWLNILKEKLSADFKKYEFTVINSGIGGNSAREAMARFEKDVVTAKPDFVILEFGGNNEDIAKPDRIVGLEEFKTLLDKYKQGLPTKTKTIIVTFPPVLDDLHAYGKNPAFKEHYQKAGGIDKSVDPYREMTRTFANENGFPIYDFYRRLMMLGKLNGRNTYTMNDGVHLTQKGNMILAEGVFEVLKNMLKQIED
ncbi:MAG: GDSL-type esterase/lipase family protein [Phycisphaerae bacterium]